MYAEERRHALVEHARAEGRISVVEAAVLFKVTPETIRRDLESLDRAGQLHRVHGGAIPTELLSLPERTVDFRETEHAAEKESIAQAALKLVPKQGTILLDSGTTTLRLARLLRADSALTVFTNSLPVAASLSSGTSANVHFLGGRIRGLTQAAVGQPEALDQLRIDVAFVGTNGVTEQHGLSTPDWDEAAMKRRMVGSAHRVVALSDSSKLGIEATVTFASLDDIDVFITDAQARPAHLTTLTNHGIEVITA
jgi:DeoR family fructose operon transcriptional repressor